MLDTGICSRRSQTEILPHLVSRLTIVAAKAKMNHFPHHFLAAPFTAPILGGPAGRGGRDLRSRAAPL